MAIETADLASLIRKVRDAQAKPTPEPEKPVPSKSAKESKPRAQAPASEPSPETKPDAQAPAPEPAVDIQDLHAELHADELLLERILGLLYRAKKRNPLSGAVSILDMEKALGLEREAATFVMDYMKSTKVIQMDDKSRMSITVIGIDYLRRSLGVAKVAAAES
ncbi:MAG: hypothetical protein FJW32_05030 [Acidobacteria bacterium]|nr:hypothetical protein [Acidobacteriota bacterium]